MNALTFPKLDRQVAMTSESTNESWSDWRQAVVALIRKSLSEVLSDVGDSDIDWDAWRPFFDEGRSPQAAVDRAFLRDL